MTKSSVQSGHFSPEIVANKASQVAEASSDNRSSGNQALVSCLASFIHHGYITEMQRMRLVNIDLSEVAHVSALADVTARDVWIQNVTGNIAPVISRIKCRVLSLTEMMLGTDDTAALVQGMQTAVEVVELGDVLPLDTVELDMNTLVTYDGRGHCREVGCWGETGERYGNQLAIWGETMGWGVRKYAFDDVVIARE